MREIIERYKGDRTIAATLEWINEGLHTRVATRTFYNWLGDDTKPNRRILNDIQAAYPVEDPRHALASELLGAVIVERV